MLSCNYSDALTHLRYYNVKYRNNIMFLNDVLLFVIILISLTLMSNRWNVWWI